MRILTVSEIKNTKNGYNVQSKASADGADAHKLIFTEDTGGAGLDIVDWAISHIGVPYCILDGTTKNPYIQIECSGLVTATRIQDIGPDNNENYRIGWIEADEYYAGRYWYYTWVDLLLWAADVLVCPGLNCRGQQDGCSQEVKNQRASIGVYNDNRLRLAADISE